MGVGKGSPEGLVDQTRHFEQGIQEPAENSKQENKLVEASKFGPSNDQSSGTAEDVLMFLNLNKFKLKFFSTLQENLVDQCP